MRSKPRNQTSPGRVWKRRAGDRRGAAILLCTLAAAVLGLAATAILRAGTQRTMQLQGLRESAASRLAGEALIARGIAAVQANPAFVGNLQDRQIIRGAVAGVRPLPAAHVFVQRIDDSNSMVTAYLYADTAAPPLPILQRRVSTAAGGPASTPSPE